MKPLLKIKKLSKRLSRVAVIVLMTAIIAIGCLSVSIFFDSRNSTSVRADAAIVLGAEVWGEEPSPVFRERINHGINLYKSDSVNQIIFTGGRGEGQEFAESIVAKNYAIRQGVSELDILTEMQSRTTYQNLYHAKQVAEKHNLNQFLIVSDPLHMKRSMLMAKDLGLIVYPSPTPTTRYQSLRSQLPFLLRETYFYLHYLTSRLFPSIYNS